MSVSRVIILVSFGAMFFVVCRAETEMVCDNQHYGEKCNMSCSGCVDGTCEDQLCKKGCDIGFWGKNCENDCPGNCHVCDQEYGYCLICHPPTEKPYLPNHYGSCYSHKPLNWPSTITGKKMACPDSMYGLDCSMSCPDECKPNEETGNSTCDKYSGACLSDGCVDGQFGWLCDQECNHLCHQSTCDRKTAECLSGCDDGWEGPWCGDRSTNVGAIVGGVIGALIVLGIIVAVLYFFVFKKRMARGNYSAANNS